MSSLALHASIQIVALVMLAIFGKKNLINIALKDSDKNPFVTLDMCARENCCCVQYSHVERRENKDHLNNGPGYKIGTVGKEK